MRDKTKTSKFFFVKLTLFSAWLFILIWTLIAIFIYSLGLYKKVYINKQILSNTNKIVDLISKDIKQNWIQWISDNILSNCEQEISEKYKSWDKLCTWKNEYFIAKKVSWTRVRMIDIKKDCRDKEQQCFLVKKSGKWTISEITDDTITFENFKIYYSKDYINKITINFTMKINEGKLFSPELIEESKLVFQTTISEKLIKEK